MNPKYFLAICLAILLIPMHSVALTQITLEWEPNTEPTHAGYKVFSRLEGETYDYTEFLLENTETACVLEIPDDEQLYYFVVRVFSTDGLESIDSNEVCYRCLAPETDDRNLLDDGDSETGGDSGCFIRSLHQ